MADPAGSSEGEIAMTPCAGFTCPQAFEHAFMEGCAIPLYSLHGVMRLLAA